MKSTKKKNPSVRITFRCTPQERKELQKYAKIAPKKDISTIVRMAVFGRE